MEECRKRRYARLAAIIVSLAGLVLIVIATCTAEWIVATSEVGKGLFEVCTTTCTSLSKDDLFPFVHATRAFMILGLLMCALSITVLTICLFEKLKNYGHFISTSLLFASSIFVMIACAVYTGQMRPILSETLWNFGYSLWMGWASGCIVMLAAPVAFYSQFKEERTNAS